MSLNTIPNFQNSQGKSILISNRDELVSNASDLINTVPDDLCHIFVGIKSLIEIDSIPIEGMIVALGSNSKNASLSLRVAREELENVYQQAVWSSEFVNPDYTATIDNPRPDYTNQCGYLLFSESNSTKFITDITQQCKLIESIVKTEAGNKATSIHTDGLDKPQYKIILIDIDVLAVKTSLGLIAIKKRYPFRKHEWIGIEELLQKGALK